MEQFCCYYSFLDVSQLPVRNWLRGREIARVITIALTIHMDYLSIRTDLMQKFNFKKGPKGIIINLHELYQGYE